MLIGGLGTTLVRTPRTDHSNRGPLSGTHHDPRPFSLSRQEGSRSPAAHASSKPQRQQGGEEDRGQTWWRWQGSVAMRGSAIACARARGGRRRRAGEGGWGGVGWGGVAAAVWVLRAARPHL